MPIAASSVLRNRCAPPALAPLPSSMSIRYCAGSLPTACASSSTMLSTAQKVQPGADLWQRQGRREVHVLVVSAQIDPLAGLPDAFARLPRRHHHVRVKTPAEAAAQPHLVHHNELGIDPGSRRRDRPGTRREL